MSSAARAAVLGKRWAPNQRGYGATRPRVVFNGGDPTGLVRDISWSNWGKRRAIGSGVGDFVWPGLSVGGGSMDAPAVLIAFGLGRCDGRLAYRRLGWYFPAYDETFDRRTALRMCSKVLYPPYHDDSTNCDDTQVADGSSATDVVVTGLSCEEAAAVLVASGAQDYVQNGGRFMSGRYRCGSQGLQNDGISDDNTVIMECRLDRADIVFTMTG